MGGKDPKVRTELLLDTPRTWLKRWPRYRDVALYVAPMRKHEDTVLLAKGETLP